MNHRAVAAGVVLSLAGHANAAPPPSSVETISVRRVECGGTHLDSAWVELLRVELTSERTRVALEGSSTSGSSDGSAHRQSVSLTLDDCGAHSSATLTLVAGGVQTTRVVELEHRSG